MNAVVKPKNWSDFQHYKDRSPAWVKLHRALLDDFEFHCLPVASRALAPMMWLLASEHQDGEISLDSTRIAFRLRMPDKDFIDAFKPLLEQGFFVVSSGALADCYQLACLEKETEEETEREKEKHLVADSDESHDEQKREKWTNEDADVAKTILREVQKVSPSQKGSKNWPDTIRLMRERDGRTHDEILAMFRWANADSFWRANILSPDKLREKWPQLEARRNSAKPGKPSAHGDFNKLDYSAGIDADGRF